MRLTGRLASFLLYFDFWRLERSPHVKVFILSYEDRLITAWRLQEGASCGEIGKELGRDRTTIAMEIQSTLTTRKAGVPIIHIIRVSSAFPARLTKVVYKVGFLGYKRDSWLAIYPGLYNTIRKPGEQAKNVDIARFLG